MRSLPSGSDGGLSALAHEFDVLDQRLRRRACPVLRQTRQVFSYPLCPVLFLILLVGFRSRIRTPPEIFWVVALFLHLVRSYPCPSAHPRRIASWVRYTETAVFTATAMYLLYSTPCTSRIAIFMIRKGKYE